MIYRVYVQKDSGLVFIGYAYTEKDVRDMVEILKNIYYKVYVIEHDYEMNCDFPYLIEYNPSILKRGRK